MKMSISNVLTSCLRCLLKGGSVAARRLAEMGSYYNILLVAYSECVNCSIAGYQVEAMYDLITGRMINTTAQNQLPGSPIISVKDPAIQGGGTAINGMLHIRGDANIFFNNFWPRNWTWNDMQNYYEMYETYTFPPGFYGPGDFDFKANLRGTHGPVLITQKGAESANGFQTRYLNAIKDVFPNITKNNHCKLYCLKLPDLKQG